MTTSTVLVTGARAPVALHMARLLHYAGKRVILADTPVRPLAASSAACASYCRLPSPRFAPGAFADEVEAIVRRQDVQLVVPTCEEVFYLAGVWRDRNMPVPLFAPELDLLARVHDKYRFIRLAESLGLTVPETILLQSDEDVQAVCDRGHALVFKPVWSRFASRVFVRPTPGELVSVRPSVQAPWVAQQFVAGDEISAYAVARGGEIKALSLYRSLYRAGKGAGICFEPMTSSPVRRFIETLVSGTAWTGQISLDLIRQDDGTIYPLECNPRATSGLHLFRSPAGFADVVLGAGGEVMPDAGQLQASRLAMWVYGLPAAVRAGNIAGFRQAMANSQELLDWPGDHAPARAQWPALAEIAGVALRNRISLQTASTHDIEWNGPAHSSM